MGKECYVVGIEKESEYIECWVGNENLKVGKKEFCDAVVRAENNGVVIGVSQIVKFSEFENGKEYFIEVPSENGNVLAKVKVIGCEWNTEKYCKNGEKIKEEIGKLQKCLGEREKYWESNMKGLRRQCELEIAREVEKVSDEKLEKLLQQLREEKVQKELLVAENLQLQNEIFELHEKMWQNEKIAKEALISKNKELLSLTQLFSDLQKQSREQQIHLESFKENSISLASEVSELKKKSPSKFKLEPHNFDSEINLIFYSLGELASKKCTNFAEVPEIKAVPVKQKKIKPDSLDEKFSDYLKLYNLQNEFEKIGEDLYTFGSKKVSISMKNGYLVVRVGGGYMMIDQFLKGIVQKNSGFITNSPSPSCKILSEVNENLNTPTKPPLSMQKNLTCPGLKAMTPIVKISRMLYK